jgi:predicted nucleic-acid-binding protein
MANRVLLDANVIIRFLVRDNEELYQKSLEIIRDIESGKSEALLLDFILAEIVYVLKRIYKIEKLDISQAIKKLLLNDNFYTDNKIVSFEALDIYANKNIDFADAMLCAKKNLEGFEIVSFDKDMRKC